MKAQNWQSNMPPIIFAQSKYDFADFDPKTASRVSVLKQYVL